MTFSLVTSKVLSLTLVFRNCLCLGILCVFPALGLLRLLNPWVDHFYQICKLESRFLTIFQTATLCSIILLRCQLHFIKPAWFCPTDQWINHLVVFSSLSLLHFKINAIAVSSSSLVCSSLLSNLSLNPFSCFKKKKIQTLLFFIHRSSIWFFFYIFHLSTH